MNVREIGEIRRHIRRDRSNMTAVYGCYVNNNKEIISQFTQSTGLMSENEGEKYFALLKRVLSGTVGKNLIDISFQTAQVVDSPEHKLLMRLRETGLSEEQDRAEFFRKVIDSVSIKDNYLILIGCDNYDIPFKSSDGETDNSRAEDVYRFLLCAICPVKQTQPKLHYIPEDSKFHDGGIRNVASAPELGFLFPAFDNRSTNIYNALYYTHSPKESHEAFVNSVFHTPIPKPAYEQKKSFAALLERALDKECSLDVVQTVHDKICQSIELHKESRVPDTLLVSKDEVKQVLSSCGVSQPHIAKFSVEYDEAFGFEADLHPKNIIDNRRFEIKTPDVSIQIAPDRADMIQTRMIGGVKYILIPADEDVEVNGVRICIEEKQEVNV